MLPVIFDRIIGRLFYNPVDAEHYRGTRITGSDIYEYKLLRGSLMLQHKKHPEWGISYQRVKVKSSTLWKVKEPDIGIRMHLLLRGSIRLKQGDGPVMQLKENDYFFSNHSGYKVLAPKNKKAVMMVLYIDKLSAGLSDNQSVLVNNTVYQLSDTMKNAVNDILYHNYNDRLLDEFYDLSLREIFFRHFKLNAHLLSGAQAQYVSFVLNADEIISNDLEGNYDNIGIARTIGSNDKTIKEKYRKSFRLGLNQKRIMIRLRLIRIRLATTDDSLEVIALSSGYRSCHALIRIFRQKFGMPPRQWRLKYKKEKL